MRDFQKKQKNGPNWAQKGPFSNFWLKSENFTFFPIFYFQNKILENSNSRFSDKNWQMERERQRRVKIYRSESVRWASNQNFENSCENFVNMEGGHNKI